MALCVSWGGECVMLCRERATFIGWRCWFGGRRGVSLSWPVLGGMAGFCRRWMRVGGWLGRLGARAAAWELASGAIALLWCWERARMRWGVEGRLWFRCG